MSAGELSPRERLDADVVVVGSGAGGAVVAAELAEAGWRVIVLEEGRRVAPEQYARMRPSETMRSMWRDGGLTFAVGLGDTPMVNVMMGRCVGGSSALTGGVCFRIPGSVLRHWSRELGLGQLSEASMEPCFEAVEHSVHVEEVPSSMRSVSSQLFVQGAERRGVVMKSLQRNTQGCCGCGRCNFGCPQGAKLSVDLTYLPRAVAAGAQVISDCRVERIVVTSGRVQGVRAKATSAAPGAGRLEARRRAGSLGIRARWVVLAAGAHGSPGVLARSGIGRRGGQVGHNLTLHPGFRVMARFDRPVRGWEGALQSVYSDTFERDRMTLVGMFVPPGVLAATLPGVGPTYVQRARQIPHLAVFGGMIHDDPGGRVQQRFGQPFITYRMSQSDREAVPRLLRRMADIYFAAGAREVFLPVLGLGGIDADGLRRLDLERVPARHWECTSQHPLGTCRMGTAPGNSVVDADGRCWDIDGLAIADGSVVPTSLGVNPQLAIMSLATRIAWRLRERRPRDRAPAG